MDELWMIGAAVLFMLAAFFVVKTVAKMALRLVLLAAIAVAALMYYTGSLQLPL